MVSTKQKAEKITLTIPSELKEQLVILKDELQISTSALYREALESYIKQKELQKWEEGAKLAVNDKKYMAFVNELSNDTGDIFEY